MMESNQSIGSATTMDSETLMNHIRKNPPSVKNINEVVNLLHVISAEQRSCNVLRSCVDKVLMNMSKIRTLRDVIERLRSVSRTNGFRFEIPSSTSPETRCQLVSDMFSVKIVLGTSNTQDHSPTVLDVSIKHKEDFRSCQHLANIIRAGNFLDLSNHLKGLMEMYSTAGSRQNKTRVFLALQSLETDLVKMSQMYRDTHKDSSVLGITMAGTVGFLTPRLAGDRPHFAYYVSPYDLVDVKTNDKVTLNEKVPGKIGLHAEVSIEQKNALCNLPISPLITNKHPIDSSGMPRFMDVSQHNSTNVQACFVLHLKPPVPVLHEVASEIRKITGFNLSSNEGTRKKYLELLGAEKDKFKVQMGDETHIYHLSLSDLEAILVNKIYFTRPAHVTQILDHLRKQAHLNTIISSCIRDRVADTKRGREWYFEVSCDSAIEKVNVTMEHPSSRGTAFLEIRLDKSGFPGCKIYTGRGDPPLCNDDFVIKVLEKCSSLPITMRKLIEQSIKNPKKEADINRVRPPALFPTSRPVLPATILTPVAKPSLQPHQFQRVLASSASVTQPTVSNSMSFLPTLPEPSTPNVSKKVMSNPMLTHLLKQDTPEQEQQQQKSNPMLLNLLKDNTDDQRIEKPNNQIGQPVGTMGSNQMHFSSTTSNSIGSISPNSFPGLDPSISMSHAMPPPSYPTSFTQTQFGANQHQPSMSPAQVPSSPYSPSVVDDLTGPVTPTNPLGMMSPGLISPGIAPGQNLPRSRRASRQKSYSIEGHEFSTLDTPQYETQPSVESDVSMDLFSLTNRPGMTPLRRTESMSPSSNITGHAPPQHSMLVKGIPESTGHINLLTRSASVSSGKSVRSMTSPGPRNLRTPESMVTMGSPPMFDTNLHQRGSRVKSFESHVSDYFRSPLTSASPGSQGGLNLGSGQIQDQDTDPFSFDDNKNPSKISMSENNAQSVSRAGRPSLFQSNSIDRDDALREYAKTKPVLFKALTADSPVSKSENTLSRQLSSSALMVNFASTAASTQSGIDFSKLMTSTSITTVSEKIHSKPNADKPSQSNQQMKVSDTKSEKTVKRRNSNKNDEGKPTGKKRGRPPSVKDASGKKRKTELGASHDDSVANPPIMLNIQLSSTGDPISSCTKTKPLVVPSHRYSAINNGSSGCNASGANNASSSIAATATPATPAFGGDLGKYFQSQQEFQKMKEMKDKKGTSKPLVTKQSSKVQSAASTTSPAEKTNPGSQPAKLGSSPRTVSGVPAPRKRKASIKDVVDKLQSKMSEVTPGSSGSPPGSNKSTVEKDSNGNILLKGKSSQPGQKMAQGGPVAKPAAKLPVDDKSAKVAMGQKATKIMNPKVSPNATIIPKQGSFMQSGAVKSNQTNDVVISNKNVDSDTIGQVLKKINEAAAASTKRNTMQVTHIKASAVKAPRPGQPAKVRSITPTSGTPPLPTGQRKSPSTQMLKTITDAAARSGVPVKISSNAGPIGPGVKKSPLRNTSSVPGMPTRPSSASSIDAPPVSILKPKSISPTAAMLSRKHSAASGDQHFVTPSISPSPKRTLSPLTRVEDKVKGMSGPGAHRPSPTHSRISTPVPSSSPRSPDGQLVIMDDSGIGSVMGTGSTSRDEQRPDFILGSKITEQSPERVAMPTPISPPPSAQKSTGAVIHQSKRAPTPRSNITSPGMSPASSASPYIIDDDLMNQAVTG